MHIESAILSMKKRINISLLDDADADAIFLFFSRITSVTIMAVHIRMVTGPPTKILVLVCISTMYSCLKQSYILNCKYKLLKNTIFNLHI